MMDPGHGARDDRSTGPAASYILALSAQPGIGYAASHEASSKG
jgi:hypothetical protein